MIAGRRQPPDHGDMSQAPRQGRGNHEAMPSTQLSLHHHIISSFGEKDKTTGQQNWEQVPAGTALEGLLLPTPPGKDYRLLKVLTQPATPDQLARLGNDRAPIVVG